MVCNARPADRRPEGAALETADDCAVDLDAPLDQREPVLEERGLRWGAPRRQRPRHGSAQGHQCMASIHAASAALAGARSVWLAV
jgi:hypothetical protein